MKDMRNENWNKNKLCGSGHRIADGCARKLLDRVRNGQSDLHEWLAGRRGGGFQSEILRWLVGRSAVWRWRVAHSISRLRGSAQPSFDKFCRDKIPDFGFGDSRRPEA